MTAYALIVTEERARSPVTPETPPRLRRPDTTLWLFPLLYTLGAWLIYGRLGLLDRTHMPTGPVGDLITEPWFLSYWEQAVVHLHVAPWTDLFNYPSGINLLRTASFPLLGVLAAPLTAAFGPVATLALLFRLAFALSSLAAFLVFRRLVRSSVAAGLGGLMYGFSPYMVTQGSMHVFLVFVPLPPVILYLIYRAFTEPGPGQWRIGGLVGVLTVVQFLICAEVAITTLVIAALTVLVLGAARLGARGRVNLADEVRAIQGFLLIAVAPMAALGWLTLRGRGTVFGGPPGGPLGMAGINPWHTIAPNANDVMGALFGSAPIAWNSSRADSGFLGPVLLIALIWIVIKCRSRPPVQAAAVLTILAWLLALGAYLTAPSGAQTSIPMLWNILARVPLIQEAEANRLSLFVDIGVVTLLVVAIDALITARRSFTPRDWALTAVIVIGVVLAAPCGSFSSAPTGADTAAAASVPINQLIPTSGVVTTFPMALNEEQPAMLWQAVGRLHFKLLDGSLALERSLAPGHSRLTLRQIKCVLYPGKAWFGNSLCEAGMNLETVVTRFVRRSHVSAVLAARTPGNRKMVAVMDRLYPHHTTRGHLIVWNTGLPPVT